MGEVYLARDERLERSVALKILPPALVRNEERLRRFVQEAKTASALSHPHIVAIYEIGQAEAAPEPGQPAETLHYIAMELVNGDTLAHLIHRERADLRVLVRYLSQAAEGLSKAHAAGVIHRDLKPANIMVTRDGYAKVLDFGLAKLTERQAASEGMTSAPTASGDATREGAVMGTVGYMSPEQVQGKAVDPRSDIFSFGCLLYETATRRRPFLADSDIETMHQILKEAPPPIDTLNPAVPAELRRLVRRCLAKSPDQRLQSMKDLAIELGEIAEEYDALTISSASRAPGSVSGAAAPARAAGPALGGVLKAAIAAPALIGLAGIVFGVWSLRRGGGSPAGRPFDSMKLTLLATRVAEAGSAALSPDGKYLAMINEEEGKASLRVRQIATGSDVQLVPPQETPLAAPTFTPDGNYIYYLGVDPANLSYRALYRIPALGGVPRRVMFDVDSAVTFSPDGRQIAFMRGAPQTGETLIVAAGADGSAERILSRLKGPASFANTAPAWSPDGQHVAAVKQSVEGGVHCEVALIGAADGRESPAGSRRWAGISDVAWLPDGSGLVLVGSDDFAASQVWLMSHPGGDVRRITNDLSNYAGRLSVTSDSKSLATVRENRMNNLWIAPAARPDEARQITFGSASDEAIDALHAAPDGSVIFQSNRGGVPAIWGLDTGGARLTRLTPEGLWAFWAFVPRRTRAIFFTALREDRVPHIWRMDPDGGHATQVTNGAGEGLQGVLPDGTRLLMLRADQAGLWRQDLSDGSIAKVADDVNLWDVSPDGRTLLLQRWRQKDGLFESVLDVVPIDGGSPIRSIDRPRGFGFRFAPDGASLAWIVEDKGVGNLWTRPLDGGEARMLTHFKEARLFQFDWSLDGASLILSRGEVTRDVVLITGFR